MMTSPQPNPLPRLSVQRLCHKKTSITSSSSTNRIRHRRSKIHLHAPHPQPTPPILRIHPLAHITYLLTGPRVSLAL
jgi:hypothetical protein